MAKRKISTADLRKIRERYKEDRANSETKKNESNAKGTRPQLEIALEISTHITVLTAPRRASPPLSLPPFFQDRFSLV